MHGAIRPFKNEMKYYQELFNVNILTLFVIALYNQLQNTTNTIADWVGYGLLLNQLDHHISHTVVTYVHSGVISSYIPVH